MLLNPIGILFFGIQFAFNDPIVNPNTEMTFKNFKQSPKST
jgi:hypothetical protein